MKILIFALIFLFIQEDNWISDYFHEQFLHYEINSQHCDKKEVDDILKGFNKVNDRFLLVFKSEVCVKELKKDSLLQEKRILQLKNYINSVDSLLLNDILFQFSQSNKKCERSGFEYKMIRKTKSSE